MRIFAARFAPGLVVVAAAVLPRLGALAYARGSILAGYVEKSDIFARMLVRFGTYGYVPGVPSAYTQPLYGWFLAGLYWAFVRDWEVVGGAQIVVAACTALVVFAIARQFLSRWPAVLAAAISTLHPYLLWHDVHVNREILDQLVAATVFLLALRLRERRGLLLAAALGACCGLAILGNARLALLPLVLAVYAAWELPRRQAARVVGVVLAACALVLAPWVVRNRVQVGCFAVTTDARSLWKANNMDTARTLAHGGWIDDVAPLPGAPQYTPEWEASIYQETGRIVRVDECAQQGLYERATISFWKHHPAEKLRLMLVATEMLWSPLQTRTQGGPQTAGVARQWLEALWAMPVFVLAAAGLLLVRRRIAALMALFLVYETLEAWLFAGATRYRISFDFVLALAAGAALARLSSRVRYRSATRSAVAPAAN